MKKQWIIAAMIVSAGVGYFIRSVQADTVSGLFERASTSSETVTNKIAVHTFMAAMRELARGNITNAQVDAAFNLDATEQNELDLIAAQYTGLATNIEKLDFLLTMHDAFILAESGFYNKAQVKARLGF